MTDIFGDEASAPGDYSDLFQPAPGEPDLVAEHADSDPEQLFSDDGNDGKNSRALSPEAYLKELKVVHKVTCELCDGDSRKARLCQSESFRKLSLLN